MRGLPRGLPLALAALALTGACGGAPATIDAGRPAAVPPAVAADDVAADPLSAPALMADVGWLAAPEQRGRGSGTADERRAAEWLAAALERSRVPPWSGAGYLHPFTFERGTFERATLAKGSVGGVGTSANVVGVIRPTDPIDDRVVVLGAHHDHVGERGGAIHPGADDNATGVAVALGIARHLAAHPERIRRTVVVAFFGAEEIGLLGSWAFVRAPTVPKEHISAMVALDMLGRPLADQPAFRLATRLVGIDATRSIGVDGLRERPWLEAIVRGACAAEGHRAVTFDDLPELVRGAVERLSLGRSDHFPFEQSGIPAVIFGGGESTDYHRPTDIVATLHPELLATRARIVRRTVEGLANREIAPFAPPRSVDSDGP